MADIWGASRGLVRRFGLAFGGSVRPRDADGPLTDAADDPMARVTEEHDRALAAVRAELALARDEADAHARQAEESGRAAAVLRAELAAAGEAAAGHLREVERLRQRLEAMQDQRDAVAASTLALVARTVAAGTGNQAILYLQTQGSPRTAVYPLADGTLAFSPLIGPGPGPGPVCLITQPKAGTYMVARLLERLGLVNTQVHVDRHGFTDYRHKSIAEAQSDYRRFTTHIPIEVSAGLTAAGQFVVGHLEHMAPCVAATANMVRILQIRDARDALVSFMRFFELPGRAEDAPKTWMELPDGPERLAAFLDQWGSPLIGMMRSVAGWRGEPGVLVCRFEELMGDAGQVEQRLALEAIAAHVGVGGSRDLVSLFMNEVVGHPTKTYSGARSDGSRHWSEQVEARFLQLGGAELQRDLGYPTAWSAPEAG
ncbi:MAG: hypothetical protein BGP12_12010 [Rhodospirillales bacterium 70-18]|nr:MAG: hypothetical protein BGP12_12010 [Rhodospirillales bacterium 70-18]